MLRRQITSEVAKQLSCANEVLPSSTNNISLRRIRPFPHMGIFSQTIIVDFGDTDAAGIVYFANYLRFFERAEAALIRTLGLINFQTNENQSMAFPCAEVHCNYESPSKFGDEIEVLIHLESISKRAVKYGFSIRNKTLSKIAATGWVTLVPMDIRTLKPVEVPEEFENKLRNYFKRDELGSEKKNE